MNRTRYLILQVFLFCLIIIFFLEYTLPTARSVISSPGTVGTIPTLWEKITTYEKSISIIGNFFNIIGPFLGVLLSYLLSRLVRNVEGKDKKKSAVK